MGKIKDGEDKYTDQETWSIKKKKRYKKYIKRIRGRGRNEIAEDFLELPKFQISLLSGQ